MPSHPSVELSMRERKKQNSMVRLKTAAKELMWADGYETVTTKAIAARADMGEATLFRYVSSKLDLFLSVYGEEFAQVVDQCVQANDDRRSDDHRESGDHIEQIVDSYELLASLYTRYPELAFTFVKESFGSSTAVGRTGLEYADRWFELLESILEHGRSTNALEIADVPAVVQNCHAIYVHEVLRSHARDLPTDGMPQRLRHRLELSLTHLIRS
ncbi:TetR/AcrR family transcriptional regulator [Aeromicrobium sp. CF3.5]|uniref:TetR/AcrR family transcriptional regulator n=1 Tax=Aeromicrobium sp. CF3.5 TaxID=3373078 RepID=UPI003EE6FFF0